MQTPDQSSSSAADPAADDVDAVVNDNDNVDVDVDVDVTVDVDVDAPPPPLPPPLPLIEEVHDPLGMAPPGSARVAAEVAVMLVILAALVSFFLGDAQVVGQAMTPALADGQRMLVSRSTYLLSAPRRGDIVLIRDPYGSGRPLARRVIGVPGEKVEARGRQVLVNNRPLIEPYLDTPQGFSDNLTGTLPFQLRNDELFVMADNRMTLDDSRTWGPIQLGDVLGRAWLVYWPPDDIGMAAHQRYQGGQ